MRSSSIVMSRVVPNVVSVSLAKFKGVRRVPGAKLFFPEEYPEVIAEEAKRLWQRT